MTSIRGLNRRPTMDESFAAAMIDPNGTMPVDVEFVQEFIDTQRVPIATHRLMDKAEIRKNSNPEKELERAFQYDLETYMIGIADKRITDYVKCPATWWDHFKASPPKRLPKWIKRWMQRKLTRPVWVKHLLEVQAYKAVCPHLAGDEEQCRGFLVRESRR